MGFHIDAASEVGCGSTFSVVLLRKEELEAIPATGGRLGPSAGLRPGRRPPSDLSGKLVLVIDDEPDSRVLLTHMIEEFGCQVIAANSGEQGLRMAREFKPQIITVDLLMPQMDGAAVIRALKAEPQLRDIPLVVVSVVAEERRGSILGAVDILEKPVARTDLLMAIDRCHLPPNARLLVVDDEADAREIIRAHLADRPFEMQMATNGREALEALATFPASLVVLDLIMPEMDGMTFLDALRADSRHQQLPVLVVTSKVLSPAEKEQLRRQKLEFVKKGELSEEGFKRLLQRILEQTESRRGRPAPAGNSPTG
jgi:CheY-like chemotaxis protein